MLGDVFSVVVPIAVCVGMIWLATRIEPHWSSKDGRRFLTMSQVIGGHSEPLGRRREVRVTVGRDGLLHLSQRSMMRTRNETFRIAGVSPDPPRGKAIYLLDPIPADASGSKMVLRLPASSAAVGVLDALLAGTT